MTPPSDPVSSRLPSLALAKRAHEVTLLLVRFGFGEFVERSGLVRLLGSKGGSEDDSSRSDEPLPVRVRMLLEELGASYIKTGQILSTRPDLIPAEWIAELKRLQGDVPAVAWDGEGGVAEYLASEYGDALDARFEWIDHEALAAGSMAQVHRARLRTGEEVVLKILRPGIRQKIAGDLELMRALGKIAQTYFTHLGFDVDSVIDEFARQLAREADFGLEARSTIRMRREFADHAGITFPRVFEGVSTSGVLVLEEVHGTRLGEVDLDALSDLQRETIVKNATDMVFRQCLAVGFFHADPHPGNVFVQEGERLCFIDCGMTGVIDPGTSQLLARLVHGVVRRNLDATVTAALLLADADSELAEDRTFRADVWRMIDQFDVNSLDSLRVGEVLNEFFALLRRYRLRCPPDIIYLIKALTTIEGVAASIAPDFDVVAHVRPYLERLIHEQFGLRALLERFEAVAVSYGDLVEELPNQVSEFFRAVRRRSISLQLEHRGVDRVTREIEHASMNVSWSLVISSIVVSAALLVLADNVNGESSSLTTVATWAIVAAMATGLVRLLSARFRKP